MYSWERKNSNIDTEKDYNIYSSTARYWKNAEYISKEQEAISIAKGKGLRENQGMRLNAFRKNGNLKCNVKKPPRHPLCGWTSGRQPTATDLFFRPGVTIERKSEKKSGLASERCA